MAIPVCPLLLLHRPFPCRPHSSHLPVSRLPHLLSLVLVVVEESDANVNSLLLFSPRLWRLFSILLNCLPLLEDVSCIADLGHVSLLFDPLIIRKTHSLCLHHGHHVPEDCSAVWFVLHCRLLPQLLLLFSHLHDSHDMWGDGAEVLIFLNIALRGFLVPLLLPLALDSVKL